MFLFLSFPKVNKFQQIEFVLSELYSFIQPMVLLAPVVVIVTTLINNNNDVLNLTGKAFEFYKKTIDLNVRNVFFFLCQKSMLTSASNTASELQ